jgi:hypothetical protein
MNMKGMVQWGIQQGALEIDFPLIEKSRFVAMKA